MTIEFQRPQLCKVMTREGWEADIAALKWKEQWVAEFKLDGHRRLLGHDHGWSRLGKERGHPRIQSAISRGVLLDGEIVMRGVTSSNSVSHELAHTPENLQFVVFDMLYLSGESVMGSAWEWRRRFIEAEVEEIWKRDPSLRDVVRLSEVHKLPKKDMSIRELMLRAMDEGIEGLVLKKPFAEYKPHSRSAWVKLKGTDDYDVVIVDCEAKPTEWRVRPGGLGKDGVLYPEGRHSDPWLAGHVGLSYGFYVGGKLEKMGSLGQTGPRAEMAQHVGKVAVVKAWGQFSDTGALRHPSFQTFRDDKSPEECTFEPNMEVE